MAAAGAGWPDRLSKTLGNLTNITSVYHFSIPVWHLAQRLHTASVFLAGMGKRKKRMGLRASSSLCFRLAPGTCKPGERAFGSLETPAAFRDSFPSSPPRFPHPHDYNYVKTCPCSVSLIRPGLAHLQHGARAVADDGNINSFSWSRAKDPLWERKKPSGVWPLNTNCLQQMRGGTRGKKKREQVL